MVDGMGGININAIETILTISKLPVSETNIYKILIYLTASLKKLDEDRDDGTKN